MSYGLRKLYGGLFFGIFSASWVVASICHKEKHMSLFSLSRFKKNSASSSGDRFKMNLCEGPLFTQILVFSLPLMLTGMLQLFFNAADLIVVGRFASHQAIAAVGATSSLAHLIVNIFFGVSVGCNVLVANYFGAKDDVGVSRSVHTSIFVAIFGGIFLAIIGIVLAKPLLRLMNTPADIIDKSAVYMWFYFAGMPFIMLYNFGSAIMRAVGDTRRPLIYLTISGIINIVLNVFFVTCCGIDVAGVAIATVISQGFASLLILRLLINSNDACHFEFKKMRIHFSTLKKILWIGVPAGIQGSFFSLSNTIIQSSVNSFGSLGVAGSTAACSLEGFVYVGSCYAFHHTMLSFAGQNMGGRNFKRILQSFIYCNLVSIIASTLLGWAIYLTGETFLGIYTDNPEAIAWGMRRMKYVFTTYGFCGIMDVVSGVLRGLGYSVRPTIMTLMGICVFRIIWVYTVFARCHSMEILMLSYPISWMLTVVANGTLLLFVYRKLIREDQKYH